jgi:hypothetical protein
MSVRLGLAGTFFMLALAPFGIMAQLSSPSVPNAKAEIVVVYWSSADCRWCSYWESSFSGMEKNFRASPEFQKLKFYRIKNARLADDYFDPSLYPPELKWLEQRYQAREFKKPFRPGWWIFVDQQLVDNYASTQDWDSKAFPKIRELVARYRNN